MIDDESSFRIVIYGDSDVGKTCLLNRYVKGYFEEYPLLTIGVDFGTKIIQVDGLKIKMQIWDTAGRQRFRSISLAYVHKADAILILCDASSKKDFIESVNYWIDAVEEKIINDDIEIVIVGNKCDKEGKIPKEEAEAIAFEHGLHYFEISILENKGINDVFNYIATAAYHLKMLKK